MTGAVSPRHPLEWYRDPDGRGVDARLHLLDRQILDRDGMPVSTVDDIELSDLGPRGRTDHSQPVVVVAILIGAAVLPRIFGGRIPRSRWDRVAWNLVSRMDAVLRLNVDADDLDSSWLERWVRESIVSRIPGGRDAPE